MFPLRILSRRSIRPHVLYDAGKYAPVSTVRDTSLYITSHHFTSLHITSHYIRQHHIISLYTTSLHIASHHITQHHIISHHSTSHHIASYHITSHGTAPVSIIGRLNAYILPFIQSWLLCVLSCSVPNRATLLFPMPYLIPYKTDHPHPSTSSGYNA